MSEHQSSQQTPSNETVQQQNSHRISFKQLYYNLLKREHSPKVDLIEKNDKYIVRIDPIGENINIELRENRFFLISFNKPNFIDEDSKVIYTESKFGKITRRVKLPSNISSYTHYSLNGSWFIECVKQI